MLDLDATTVISRSPEAVYAGDPPELLMMHFVSGRCVALDGIGYCIWESLESPRSLSDLIDQLAAEFSADRDVVGADVIRFLLQMHQYELVVLAPGCRQGG